MNRAVIKLLTTACAAILGLTLSTAPGATAAPLDVFGIAKDAQHQIQNGNPQAALVGSDDQQLRKWADGIAESDSRDPLIMVKITRRDRTGRSFQVEVTRRSEPPSIPAATLQDPGDIDGDRLRQFIVRFAGETFTDRSSVVTPALKTGGRTMRAWGNGVQGPAVDDAGGGYRVVQYDGKDGDLYRRSVTVSARRSAMREIAAGRFYIDISDSCTVRDPVYDRSGRACKLRFPSVGLRVTRRRVTTYHLLGGPVPPGGSWLWHRGLSRQR